MSNDNSAIVFVIDRLGASWLGPYGNTWVETPAFNRLAADGLLFEHAIVDADDLSQVYRSYWKGGHALCPPSCVAANSVIDEVGDQGVETVLISDDAAVGDEITAEAFRQRVDVTSAPTSSGADAIVDTGTANLCSAAADVLSSLKPPFLLWVHCRGMAGPWDAPYSLRESFATEDDPVPPEFTEVPEFTLSADFDPDELLGYVHAYAGQVIVIDECLEGVLAAVNQRSDIPLLLLVTSPRGFPLGEHLRVGTADGQLHSETVHVPYLLRYPQGRDGLRRFHDFVQPGDVRATLAEWFGMQVAQNDLLGCSSLRPATETDGEHRDRVCATSHSERLLRTQAWQLRVLLDGSSTDDVSASPDMELFAKPDDRFEANGVGGRCPDVVEAMRRALLEFEEAASMGDAQRLSALPKILTEGLE